MDAGRALAQRVRAFNAEGGCLRAATGYGSVSCPNAERVAYKEQVTFAQRVLLYSDACELVVEIIRKLWESRAELQRV